MMMIFSFKPDGNSAATQSVEYLGLPGSVPSFSQLWPCVHVHVCTHTCVHPLIHCCFPIKRKPIGIESLTCSLNECKESMYLAEGERTDSPAWSLVDNKQAAERSLLKTSVLGSEPSSHANLLQLMQAWSQSDLRVSQLTNVRADELTCHFAIQHENSFIVSCPEIGNWRRRKLC